ncbi:MAG: TetR family transcriptional regulator [Ilumatobacteraceae bacterium]
MNQRELQRLETRSTLAEHALRLFHDRGFDETTVEEIAIAAGVSQRTFFLHFATKAAAAFPDHDERVINFTRRLGNGAEPGNPLLHLCQVMSSGLDTSSPMRRTRYQLLDKVAALRDEDARTDRDYEDVVANYLMQAWGDDPETRVRANAVANAALGVARASLVAWSVEGIDPRGVCFEILHRMIGAPFDIPLQSLQSP